MVKENLKIHGIDMLLFDVDNNGDNNSDIYCYIDIRLIFYFQICVF
jgi:hypothetical protein